MRIIQVKGNGEDLNCTVKELKPMKAAMFNNNIRDLNCTVKELKLSGSEFRAYV